MKNPLIEYNFPKKPDSPLIYSFPHSGRDYKNTISNKTALKNNDRRISEDFYVDKIFSNLINKNTFFIKAKFPRCYVDVNRSRYEIDAKLFKNIPENYEIIESAYNISGFGVIPRKVSSEKDLYDSLLPFEEYKNRIARVYNDWHDITENLIQKSLSNFGVAFLIDCHSMPSEISFSSSSALPDFVIGNLFGDSSEKSFNYELKKQIKYLNYSISFNKPFSGNYILKRHSRKKEGINAVQVEINRSLYIEEKTLKLKIKAFKKLQKNINSVFVNLKKSLKGYYNILKVAE